MKKPESEGMFNTTSISIQSSYFNVVTVLLELIYDFINQALHLNGCIFRILLGITFVWLIDHIAKTVSRPPRKAEGGAVAYMCVLSRD